MNIDIVGGLRGFIDNSRHVLNISYKPTNDEFRKSAKMIIISILIIGSMGFIIGILVSLLVTGTIPLAAV